LIDVDVVLDDNVGGDGDLNVVVTFDGPAR
jgi:hypothetical protein